MSSDTRLNSLESSALDPNGSGPSLDTYHCNILVDFLFSHSKSSDANISLYNCFKITSNY